ncbi:hypothetical protein BX600DRAFT_475996 [Xylariales sp. PMI_506]|nr:hypothetical protein BX600DRAFT_475996 [Xylariales sp. PMI_506]
MRREMRATLDTKDKDLSSGPGPPRVTVQALSNELLLHIFESSLPPSALASCRLCCHRWDSIANSVLSRHLVVSTLTLRRWADRVPAARDALVETLTLRVVGVGSGPGSMETTSAMRELMLGLNALTERLLGMAKLRSFSLYAPESLPMGLWMPASAIVATLSALPETCVSLEIDVRDTHDRRGFAFNDAHICLAIRARLPTLRFLRLNLFEICPEIAGLWTDAPEPAAAFEPAAAPDLTECLIKVQEPWGSSPMRHSQVCGRRRIPCAPTMATALKAFASSGDAPRLRRLLVMDVLPTAGFNSFGAVVRRDVLAERSFALPFIDVVGPRSKVDGALIRLPDPSGGDKTRDVVTSAQGVRGLAEKNAWGEAHNGTRLPRSLMDYAEGLTRVMPITKSAHKWRAATRTTCALWASERASGQILLGCRESHLTDDSVLRMHIPAGWELNSAGFLQKIGMH